MTLWLGMAWNGWVGLGAGALFTMLGGVRRLGSLWIRSAE